jgi:3'(2'), 5'-bisphosphate nucleotidase
MLFAFVVWLSLLATLSHGLITPITTVVSVNELLSTCVDACARGCAEIRAVQERRHHAGGALEVEFKDVADPKSALTEADCKSQAAIVHSLRHEWGPQLMIVGEEDENDAPSSSNEINNRRLALKRYLCAELIEKDYDDKVSLSDVILFVDPLDGTKEFVEQRLSNCQALVGIAVAGKAVAGAVGIPFPSGTTLENETTIVYYGQIGLGHGVLGPIVSPSSDQVRSGKLPRPYLATGDDLGNVMVEARKATIERFGGSTILYGGAGNKILATALGHVDGVIQHKYGGPWDVCAPEAIIVSMGGKLTDFAGNDIIAYQKDKPSYFNELGFIATSKNSGIDHDELTRILKAIPAVQQYREAIMRKI